MSSARLVGCIGLALIVAGCARRAEVAAPKLERVDSPALEHLVRGVDSAKEPSGRDKALDELARAAERDPDLWEARYDLGVLLAQKGELSRAEDELTRAAALAPNAEDVALALGEVRRRRGEPAEA
ncbi:MAG: tetratricopeptide repeat protein, partial [Deltaproteobacteria bacterium]|nr:tetratricopeptide repeat protein [Deltaproteobacteria bacterium]